MLWLLICSGQHCGKSCSNQGCMSHDNFIVFYLKQRQRTGAKRFLLGIWAVINWSHCVYLTAPQRAAQVCCAADFYPHCWSTLHLVCPVKDLPFIWLSSSIWVDWRKYKSPVSFYRCDGSFADIARTASRWNAASAVVSGSFAPFLWFYGYSHVSLSIKFVLRFSQPSALVAMGCVY